MNIIFTLTPEEIVITIAVMLLINTKVHVIHIPVSWVGGWADGST